MQTPATSERHFDTNPAMRQRYDRVARSMALSAATREELECWRQAVREKLYALTGYATMQPAPLEPVITDEATFDGYRRQRVEIQTEPGVIMPFFVLIPDGASGPRPAVIATHGHGSKGKRAVVNDPDTDELAQSIAHYNYDYGIQFVREGFIVFCPDARGFGERVEACHRDQPGPVNSCYQILVMGIPLGQTVAGMWAWDISRLIDYIQTRPDCLPDKIGCAGLSGGGLQTLYATALDERIACAVSSGYFYGVKESLLDLINCACNYVPHLYEYVDMGDLGALIAPRPFLVETGDHDPLNGASGLDNVFPQVEITRKAYRLCDAEDALEHAIFPGEHKWFGAAIPWMKRWLMGSC